MYEDFAERAEAQRTMRPRMLRGPRDNLIILCIRHPGVRAEARMSLKPEHFSLPEERPHQLILRHLWALIDKGGYAGTVPHAALHDSIAAELVDLAPEKLNEAWIGEAIDDPSEPGWEHVKPGLLRRAYDKDLAAFDDKYAFDILREFLEERAVVDAAAALVERMGSRVPRDYPARLRTLYEASRRIGSIGQSPIALPMPAGWSPRPLVRFPTGCEWIDAIMKGQVAGDVNGLLGPFGGGKTTGLTQIAVMTGRYFLAEALETGRKPRVALLVSYEEEADLIRARVMSCAARISKTRLEEMSSIESLTRHGHLAPYEMTMYREEGKTDFQHLDGEYERFLKAQEEVNQTLRIVDMRQGTLGTGWVDELSGYIDRFQHEEGVEIGVVCLDYVNAMCRRHVDTLDRVRDSTLREKIQQTPLRVEELIAKKHGCTVWLAQQFSGEANKKAAGARMMLADASEAKSFGENLVFCIAFGATDPKTGCMQATFVKARRLGIQGQGMVVKLDGDLARLVSMNDLFTVENNRIVDRRMQKHFDGATAAPSPFLVDGADVASW